MRKGRPVLIMGLLTVMTGIATSGAVLFLKMVITQKGGLESAGYFQAAWIIANSYLGIAITALGTDLYPRLSAVNANRTGFMHIMNNYMRNGLVLITPLLILLIIFAPLAVNILYSSAFAECASLLRWLMLAFFFRSLSMMMSYGLLARARKKAYLIIEIMWYMPFLSISYFGFDRWGLDAVGIASLISYIIYFVLLSAELITSGYRIDRSVINSGMIYSITLISVFLIQHFYNNIYGTIIASLVMLPAMYFSLRDINRMYPLGETVNILINKLLRK